PPASDREAPYRGAVPPASSRARVLTRGDEDAAPRRRYKRAAFALAFALPVGGGHFYAQHGAAGAMFAAGIVAGVLGAAVSTRTEPLAAAFLLVLIDMLTAPRAVARYNAGRVPSARAQRVWSLGAIVVAYVAATAGGIVAR